MESLKAYSTILNNKQYRSPDEIELSKGLNEILKDIEVEQVKLDNEEQLEEHTYENNQACEVCD